MRLRMGIAALVFMMIQAVMFGIGAVLVLATPLSGMAMQLLPVVVIASTLLSAPLSWWLAPRLRARYWKQQVSRENAGDRVLAAIS